MLWEHEIAGSSPASPTILSENGGTLRFSVYAVGMTDPRGLRSDAERNRAKILDAACEAFTEGGLDVSMEQVARRAGVGIATLYRRFPSRPDLIAAAFEAKMLAYADAVAEALAEPDPWVGFCLHLERVCAMQAADQGFTDVLTMTFPTAPGFESERVRAYEGCVELIARAKAAGGCGPTSSPRTWSWS